VIEIVGKLLSLLDTRERKRFYFLVILSVLMGLVDMSSVASVMPLLAALSNPELISTNPYLSDFYVRMNFSSSRSFLIFLTIVVLSIVLFSLIFKVGTLYAMSRFGHMRNHSISRRLLDGYLHQPYVWFLNRHSANLGRALLYDVDKVVGDALIPTMKTIANLALLFAMIALLMWVNLVAALATTVIIGGTYVLIFLVVRNLLSRIGQQRMASNNARYKIAQEALGGIKEVKLLGLEANYLARYAVQSRLLANNASLSQIIGELPRNLLEAISFMAMIGIVLFLLLTSNGGLEDVLPSLGVFAFASLRMFPAVQQIYNALTKLRYSKPMLQAVHRDLTDGMYDLAEKNYSGTLPKLQSRLDLLDISYSYPNTDLKILNGLSLSIPANSTVGIVGETGAGKTTTIDIILGLLQPKAGEFCVDGIQITPDNLRGWQNTVGYVPQQIYLIDDTISANIALGVPLEHRDQAAIETASKLAELHNFVLEELPQGYDTEVGERGVRLSGGQRQRIGIARALYRDPDVLILDEATSALDNITEQAVMDAVHNLGNSKTIIMIAHRLSTVRSCDIIYLMEDGKVAAQGSYDSLVSENKSFRRMATIGAKN